MSCKRLYAPSSIMTKCLAMAWLHSIKSHTYTFTDRTHVMCLQHVHLNLHNTLPKMPVNAVLTDAMAKALIAKLDMTFVASDKVFPFVVGDVATNSAAEYVLLRQLLQINQQWQQLTSNPGVEKAAELLQSVKNYTESVTANTSQSHLVLPSTSQLFAFQENLERIRAAAQQVIDVQFADTGVIATKAFAFPYKGWSLVNNATAQQSAALHHMKACARSLESAESVDINTLATAIEWSNLLLQSTKQSTAEYEIVKRYAAAARSTNMQLPKSTVVTSALLAWQ